MTRTLSNKKKSLKGRQRHSAGNIVNGVSSEETYDNASLRGSQDTTTMSGEDDEDEDGDDDDDDDLEEDLDATTTTATVLAESSEVGGGGGVVGGGGGRRRGAGGGELKRGGKPMLGRTPNHLSLSTTSTLSTGSTGSTAAKLIQASNTPSNYQPPSKDPPAGSPVWKPRDGPAVTSADNKSPLLTVAADGHRPETNAVNRSWQPHPQQQQYFVYDEYNQGNTNRTQPSANKDSGRYVPGRRVDC